MTAEAFEMRPVAGNSFYQPGFLAINLWFVHSICPFLSLVTNFFCINPNCKWAEPLENQTFYVYSSGSGWIWRENVEFVCFCILDLYRVACFWKKPREMWGFYSLVFRYRTRGLCFDCMQSISVYCSVSPDLFENVLFRTKPSKSLLFPGGRPW